MRSTPIILDWLLTSNEPWTRYRARLDLLDQGGEEPEVRRERAAMLDHAQVKKLVSAASSWPGYPLKRHNDPKHPIQSLVVLADFGIKHTDPGMTGVVKAIVDHQAQDGAFQTLMFLYHRFGGLDGEHWVWMGCDAPVLLYVLEAFGCGDRQEVKKARRLIKNLIRENGWPCSASHKLGNFKGPGKREDPCPIATLQGLKALSVVKGEEESEFLFPAIDMLLTHWEIRSDKKYYLFGVGTDYKKLKYPLIWYDILHVVDVLSNFPQAVKDPRFHELMEVILSQADDDGRYTASSMYMAWKGWSFADKKTPSPWLTFLVERVRKRAGI